MTLIQPRAPCPPGKDETFHPFHLASRLFQSGGTVGREGEQQGWTGKSIPRILASSSTPDTLQISPWGPGGLENRWCEVLNSRASVLPLHWEATALVSYYSPVWDSYSTLSVNWGGGNSSCSYLLSHKITPFPGVRHGNPFQYSRLEVPWTERSTMTTFHGTTNI